MQSNEINKSKSRRAPIAPGFFENTTMKDSTKTALIASVELRDWRARHNLTDAQIKHIMTSLGWEHLLSGYQQRRAAKSVTERKSAAARANGKLGGRPRTKKLDET